MDLAQLCGSLAVWSWASHRTSLSSDFSCIRRGVITTLRQLCRLNEEQALKCLIKHISDAFSWGGIDIGWRDGLRLKVEKPSKRAERGTSSLNPAAPGEAPGSLDLPNCQLRALLHREAGGGFWWKWLLEGFGGRAPRRESTTGMQQYSRYTYSSSPPSPPFSLSPHSSVLFLFLSFPILLLFPHPPTPPLPLLDPLPHLCSLGAGHRYSQILSLHCAGVSDLALLQTPG